jgi:hypothetical protein
MIPIDFKDIVSRKDRQARKEKRYLSAIKR